MRPALATCLLGLTLLAGCDLEQDEPANPTPPDDLVGTAARSTFAKDALAVRLSVRGERRSWSAEGLEVPARGRFRVVAQRPGPVVADSPLDRKPMVIGTDGEGFENTYYARANLGPPDRDRYDPCWFNPHEVVGFAGSPISVEQSVRLSGAVLESLRSETAFVRATGPTTFLVQLEPRASHPRNDFRETKRRVWGDRNLLSILESPIRVTTENGLVSRTSLTLSEYGPRGFGMPSSEPQKIRITADLAPTAKMLTLNKPGCLATE